MAKCAEYGVSVAPVRGEKVGACGVRTHERHTATHFRVGFRGAKVLRELYRKTGGSGRHPGLAPQAAAS